MSDNFREFKSQGEENHSDQTKKSGNGRKNQGKTIVTIVIAILFVGIVAFESVYSIKEQEQGVVTTFGKAGSVVTSGLHFKIPFIQRVTKVNTTILGFPIGYNPSGSQEVSEEEAAAEETTEEQPEETQEESVETGEAQAQNRETRVKESVNVRSDATTDSDRIALAYQGDAITEIESYDNGWSKVEYKGQTGYVKTEFLE